MKPDSTTNSGIRWQRLPSDWFLDYQQKTKIPEALGFSSDFSEFQGDLEVPASASDKLSQATRLRKAKMAAAEESKKQILDEAREISAANLNLNSPQRQAQVRRLHGRLINSFADHKQNIHLQKLAALRALSLGKSSKQAEALTGMTSGSVDRLRFKLSELFNNQGALYLGAVLYILGFIGFDEIMEKVGLDLSSESRHSPVDKEAEEFDASCLEKVRQANFTQLSQENNLVQELQARLKDFLGQQGDSNLADKLHYVTVLLNTTSRKEAQNKLNIAAKTWDRFIGPLKQALFGTKEVSPELFGIVLYLLGFIDNEDILNKIQAKPS